MTNVTLPVHRTILVVDVERSTRTRAGEDLVRYAVHEALEEAFRHSQIPWEGCVSEDHQEGTIILVPPDVPKRLLVDPLPEFLVRELNAHNSLYPEEERTRLRMALHAGEVAHGEVGSSVLARNAVDPAITLAFRLVSSAALHTALAESSGILGMIVSSYFYEEVVRHHPTIDPRIYRSVRVGTKQSTAQAWVSLPDDPRARFVAEPGHGPVAAGRNERADVVVCAGAADRSWAEWIAWQLREAGHVVEIDEWTVTAGENLVDRLELVRDRGDRAMVVLSTDFLRMARTMSESTAAFAGSTGVIPVRVDPIDVGGLISDRAVVDLVHTGAETARERLLAALQGNHVPRSAPAYPGEVAHPGTGAPGATPAGLPRPRRKSALLVYAEPDSNSAVELVDALQVLLDEGVLASIDERPVTWAAGEDVDPRAREAATVLLLVTRDLLATEYGLSNELRIILTRHDNRHTVLIPILVKPAAWERQPFARIAPLPTGGTPVQQWSNRERALKNIVDGVRMAAQRGRRRGSGARAATGKRRTVYELGDVFKQSGLPTHTFVEPEDFVGFKMALRQPGLGVVLEGPSGIGKTTWLRQAFEHDGDRLGRPSILSARKPEHVARIRRLDGSHTGIVAVDDFHRLPTELQDRLADLLKVLADDDTSPGKLVIVGIPGTARNLIDFASDIVNRVKVFEPQPATESLVLQMIEKGEQALNITFDGKAEIARASAGSLQTAQMLCYELAVLAGIEQTVERHVDVRTDSAQARAKVIQHLELKYQAAVNGFIVLDQPSEPLCIELLIQLAGTADGIVCLDDVAAARPHLAAAIERVFVAGLPRGLAAAHPQIAEHLYYDPGARRLIADDPQFRFYLNQLSRDELLEAAGKRLPVTRDQVFVSYSHRDADWLDRVLVHLRPLERLGIVDVWSDRRLESGDVWRKEIVAALDRARVALLLVSSDFLASDFVDAEELPPLLAAADQGGCRVVPIQVRPSVFDRIPSLACYQGVPGDTTLSELPAAEADRVLANLARELFG
jgi:hypothetical protein